jgi:hypothetical protein
MTTLELFATFGVVADWALLLLGMHPAKIPILLPVGAAVSTLLDTLAGGVGTGESEASLSLGASHCLGPCVKHLALQTLSDRFFSYLKL